MGLRIKANSAFVARYLDVEKNGVTFCETAAMGGQRVFRFDQIECVLMSPENVLSFQVGREVFSLPVKPNYLVHEQAIAALLQGVQRVAGGNT
jgi:hypothetical protein